MKLFVCGWATVILLMLSMPTALSADEILFSDDFEDGIADGWFVVEFGEYEMVGGALCLPTY
jgi:hypothetical protein